MAKPDNLDEYEVFYMEIPHADYFADIEIQDEYEPSSPDKLHGLSDAQVSEIARDSLDAAKNKQDESPESDQNLFSDSQE